MVQAQYEVLFTPGSRIGEFARAGTSREDYCFCARLHDYMCNLDEARDEQSISSLDDEMLLTATCVTQQLAYPT